MIQTGRSKPDRPSPAGAAKAARRVSAVLLLLLAGCASMESLQTPAEPSKDQPAAEKQGNGNGKDESAASKEKKTDEKCPSCQAGNGDTKDENSTKSNHSPPKPKTICEAFEAYCHCLHYGPPPAKKEEEKKDNNHKDEQGKEGKKSEPAQGDEDKNRGDKTTLEKNGQKDKDTSGEQGKEGKKNEPAQGDEDKKKEENGEKKEEKKDEEKTDEKEKEPEETWFSAHAQATLVTQKHDQFPSPYIGLRSLLPNEPDASSMTGTIFLDMRLWECCGNTGELIFDPEVAGGQGFSGVQGIAGFPNGEITRVGVVEPTPYIARLFLRETCALGDETEKVEDEANQIAGTRPVDRLTFMIGKLAATDVVDDNVYSHDPRTQFLNWSIMYNSAWDYPANVRGYTYGFAFDYNRKDWALRYGIFAEPSIANGAPLDPHFLKANGQVAEYLQRYKINEHPGNLRLLAYLNHAHMGDYAEATEEMPVNPDVTLTRAYRFKYGFGLSWDQEITKDLGVFSRLGWNDGHTETWAYTAVDRTAVLGLALKGRCWCRPDDVVGLAGVLNGISADHRAYLAAGGFDYIIGDGRLRYGPEEILEVYYDYQIIKGIFLTGDFQEVGNPAYNRDRGPVSIFTIRAHIEL